MTYTMKKAGLTLSMARYIMNTPTNWQEQHIERAKIVVSHWEKTRGKQHRKNLSKAPRQ